MNKFEKTVVISVCTIGIILTILLLSSEQCNIHHSGFMEELANAVSAIGCALGVLSIWLIAGIGIAAFFVKKTSQQKRDLNVESKPLIEWSRMVHLAIGIVAGIFLVMLFFVMLQAPLTIKEYNYRSARAADAEYQQQIYEERQGKYDISDLKATYEGQTEAINVSFNMWGREQKTVNVTVAIQQIHEFYPFYVSNPGLFTVSRQTFNLDISPREFSTQVVINRKFVEREGPFFIAIIVDDVEFTGFDTKELQLNSPFTLSSIPSEYKYIPAYYKEFLRIEKIIPKE